MQTNPSKNHLFTPIERLALFIHNLPQQDKAKLVTLVPELQTIEPEPIQISQEQSELMAFFEQLSDSSMPSLPDNELFIQGLSFSEFFKLSEDNQATIWQDTHPTIDISKRIFKDISPPNNRYTLPESDHR